MKVVGGFDEALSGWMKRLAVTSTSAADSWDFTSETLSKLYYLRQSNDVSWLRYCFHRIVTVRPYTFPSRITYASCTYTLLEKIITRTVKMELHFVEFATFLVRNSN